MFYTRPVGFEYFRDEFLTDVEPGEHEGPDPERALVGDAGRPPEDESDDGETAS